MFAQDSLVLNPPNPCLLLFVFKHLPPPISPKVHLIWLEITLSTSIFILVRFIEKKLLMITSIFGSTQRVF